MASRGSFTLRLSKSPAKVQEVRLPHHSLNSSAGKQSRHHKKPHDPPMHQGPAPHQRSMRLSKSRDPDLVPLTPGTSMRPAIQAPPRGGCTSKQTSMQGHRQLPQSQLPWPCHPALGQMQRKETASPVSMTRGQQREAHHRRHIRTRATNKDRNQSPLLLRAQHLRRMTNLGKRSRSRTSECKQP